jgi:hypothetical protein
MVSRILTFFDQNACDSSNKTDENYSKNATAKFSYIFPGGLSSAYLEDFLSVRCNTFYKLENKPVGPYQLSCLSGETFLKVVAD